MSRTASVLMGALAMLAPGPSMRILDCRSSFPPHLAVADLEKRYGAHELGSGELHTGEGRGDDVTVLFPGSAEDRSRLSGVTRRGNGFQRRSGPVAIAVVGGHSPGSLRMDLRSAEALNRRPSG